MRCWLKIIEYVRARGQFNCVEYATLNGAVGFYKDRNYENVLVHGRVQKIKKLPQTVQGVVPVFGWTDTLSAKLNVRVDTDLLKNSKHQPIFVYVNDKQRIDGVAVRLSNGKEIIKYKAGRLSADMAKYRALELSDALYMVR